jgi:hypothetical protein
VAFVVVAVVGVWRRVDGRKAITDPRAVAVAEDDVYETVVRHLYIPSKKSASAPDVAATQLVFSSTLDTCLCPGVDSKACLDGVRQRLRGAADGSIRSETIDNFIKQSQAAGTLSTTFKTDLPRTFVAPDSLYLDIVPIEKNGQKSFYESFPRASGIISFSHVGFDSTLHEAIVSTSIVCGGLCGTGRRYVLRKKWGKWEVVDAWVVWVS